MSLSISRYRNAAGTEGRLAPGSFTRITKEGNDGGSANTWLVADTRKNEIRRIAISLIDFGSWCKCLWLLKNLLRVKWEENRLREDAYKRLSLIALTLPVNHPESITFAAVAKTKSFDHCLGAGLW